MNAIEKARQQVRSCSRIVGFKYYTHLEEFCNELAEAEYRWVDGTSNEENMEKYEDILAGFYRNSIFIAIDDENKTLDEFTEIAIFLFEEEDRERFLDKVQIAALLRMQEGRRDKNPHIIAAFAGCGKSWFCEKYPQAMDFVAMPFKYENFYEVAAGLDEGESIKANEELILNRNWLEDYYHAITETRRKFPDEIIVIPTVDRILERLEADDIPYTIVFPKRDLKEEYRKRFIERGNTEAFLRVFIDRWDYWMEEMEEHQKYDVVRLEQDQYLSDVITPGEYNREHIIEDKEHYIYSQYFEGKANELLY